MKDIEENAVVEAKVTSRESQNTISDRQYEQNSTTDNRESGLGHGDDARQDQNATCAGDTKQRCDAKHGMSIDRDRGPDTGPAYDISPGGRYVRRYADSVKRPNTVKRQRRHSSERRVQNGGRNSINGGKRSRFVPDQNGYVDHLESDEEVTDDCQSESDVSFISNSPGLRVPSNERSWSESRSKKHRYPEHQDEWHRKGRRRHAFQRLSYEHDVPSYSPYFSDIGRLYQLRSPMASEVHMSELFTQMLQKQDLMLARLDSIVGLLQKTVRSLPTNTGKQHEILDRGHSEAPEQVVTSSRKRTNEHFSETELEKENGAFCEPRQRRKEACPRPPNGSARGNSDIEYVGKMHAARNQEGEREKPPEMYVNIRHNDHILGSKNKELAPKISSYYSVRTSEERGTRIDGFRKEKGEESPLIRRRMRVASVQEHDKGVEEAGYGMKGETNAEKDERDIALESKAAEEKELGASGDEQVTTASNGHFADNGDVTAYIVSPEYLKDGAAPKDAQRNLKMMGRPSMVDLSQTSNAIMPQRFHYSVVEGFSQVDRRVDDVGKIERISYGDEAVPCVYPAQSWQGHETADSYKNGFSPNGSYRKRDSGGESKSWLARTFTTGSGHSEDFPRSMVTNGHETSNADGATLEARSERSSLTDNKKMMSNITHLTLSSIVVSSEIVQILVATPSDHNSNKDYSRKSLERLLNQSLSFMGCLPLIAEIDLSVVQKVYQSSKNCMSFIYRLMDHCYTREELIRCRVAGGVRRYRGNNTETEQLCPKRLRTVLKLASDLFPNEYIKLSKANMIRNNINMKCRKTVIRDGSN